MDPVGGSVFHIACCGHAVVVSFTFGVKGAGDVIHSPGLAAPGLVILVAGIAGIALNGQVAARRHETQGLSRPPHPPAILMGALTCQMTEPADTCAYGTIPVGLRIRLLMANTTCVVRCCWRQVHALLRRDREGGGRGC